MKDKGFPLDDTKITIFLNPRSTLLNEVHISFKISKFSISQGVYNLTGTIDVSSLYVKEFKSYPSMTSFKAFQQIAKDIGLGFSSNINDTNDQMTWINTGDVLHDFMDSIVENSYMSDKTYLMYYIDLYYNLTYVDLEKEFNRDIKKELGVDNLGLESIANIQDQERVSQFWLTNDAVKETTNSYFKTYKIINNSTQLSLQEGYRTQTKFYDELNKDFLIFNIDSITDNADSKIIMKASPQDEVFYNQNTNLIYTGKLDVDNMHNNYLYALVQNDRNLIELEKIGLEIEMGNPNFSLYKYQKVYILISNQAPTPAMSQNNNRLSGEWLITDISFKFDGITMNQILRLVKKSLELSPDELASEPPQSPKNNQIGQNNFNPSGTSSNPFGNGPTFSNNTIFSGPTYSQNGNSGFPLTIEIWRAIYNGKVNTKVIELYYQPTVNAMIQYGINTKERIAAFLSQANAETGFLTAVTEYGSGDQYNGNKSLGNISTGDGSKFKGRGLAQITGRSNYKQGGNFLNIDFTTDPTVVAAANSVEIRAAATPDQVSNTVLSAIWFWMAGSSWGNLNSYADNMNINNPLGFGSTSLDQLPNTQQSANNMGYKVKKKNNIATVCSPSDVNFNNFTLICFGVNGGYNGFQQRCQNWLQIRQYFILYIYFIKSFH